MTKELTGGGAVMVLIFWVVVLIVQCVFLWLIWNGMEWNGMEFFYLQTVCERFFFIVTLLEDLLCIARRVSAGLGAVLGSVLRCGDCFVFGVIAYKY